MNPVSKKANRRRLRWIFLGSLGAAAIIALVVWRSHAFHHGYVNPWLIEAAGLAVLAVALHFRQPWSRWLGVCLLGAGLVASTWLFATGDLAWYWGVAMLVQAGLMWDAWQLKTELPDEPEEEAPFLSLVLLFREPIYLEAEMLAEMASRAWDAEVTAAAPEDDESATESVSEESFVAGDAPHFICTHWPGFFTINNFDEPYFEDIDEVADEVPEMRVRAAVEQHRAWASVDLVHWFGDEGEDGRRDAYRLIARLLAEIADDNCLAVIDPGASAIFAYDPETEQKLRSDDPLESLREWYYAPILAVEPDDPEMQAAVAEARRRWPDFVSAFEKRDLYDHSPFMIKAPFTDGTHTEFMWVQVTGMENQIVYGTLENTPANVSAVEEGDIVRVKVGEINDWLCTIEGDMAGAFTMKVLNDRTDSEFEE